MGVHNKDTNNPDLPDNPLGLGYTHPLDTVLRGITYAMKYNESGEPCLRIDGTTSGGDSNLYSVESFWVVDQIGVKWYTIVNEVTGVLTFYDQPEGTSGTPTGNVVPFTAANSAQESFWVEDDADPVVKWYAVINESTGEVTYYDTPGGTAGTPTHPVVPVLAWQIDCQVGTQDKAQENNWVYDADNTAWYMSISEQTGDIIYSQQPGGTAGTPSSPVRPALHEINVNIGGATSQADTMALVKMASVIGCGTEDAIGSTYDLVHIAKFGYNSNVGTSMETIWDHGGSYVYPSVAGTVTITSDDVDDVPGGTGAREVTISGVDSNWDPTVESIALNGTSTTSFMRVFRMQVTAAGSSNVNEGTITAKILTNPVAYIHTFGVPSSSGLGQTEMAMYTVPAGFTGYLTEWTVTLASNKEVYTRLIIKNQVTSDVTWRILDSLGSSNTKTFTVPMRIPEKTDVEVVAAAAATASVFASFCIILYRN